MKSKVVIIGCGGLGSVQAESLCRAGVGHLRIVDRDFLEESNLQRQSLFAEQDVRDCLPKAVAAKNRLQQVNSQVEIEALVTDVCYKNISRIVAEADCILDGTDNFETRFLINDVCVQKGIPWVYGAAVASHGLTMTIIPSKTPCLRCVFESMPPPGISPTCDTAGVLASIINVIASLQVSEAIKILTGHFDTISRDLILIDLWHTSFRRLQIANARADGNCPACALGRFEFLEGRRTSTATTLCGRDAVQISRPESSALDFAQLAERLQLLGAVQFNRFLLRFRVQDYEIAVFSDGRSIIKGTQDADEARSIYAKYIGN